MRTTGTSGTAKAGLSAVHASLIIAAAAAAALAVAAPHLSPVRERQAAGLPLDGLRERVQGDASTRTDPIFLYYLGRRLNEAGRFTDASPVLEQAAGLEPATARIRDEWARAQVGAGQPSHAFAQLMQFAGANPTSSDGYRLVGKFHVTQKAYAAARTSLEKAVALDPRDAAAWSLLANCRIGMGDTAGGQAALDKALALRPEGAEAAPDWLQRASLQAGAHPDIARDAFQKTIRLAPNNPEAHREYARFLIAQANFDEAEREARAALGLAPEDAQAHYLLGKALAENGSYRAAVVPLDHAAHLAPDDPQPAAELQRIFRQLNDPAQVAFWRAEQQQRNRIASELKIVADQVRARPTDRALRRRMAQLLARVGDVPGVVRESALALRMKPDSPQPLLAAGRVLQAAGRGRDALPLVRQALMQLRSLNSFSPDALELLGGILLEMGRLHEAAIQFQRISDIRPDQVETYRRQITRAAERLRQNPSPGDRLLERAASALARGDAAGAEKLAGEAVAQEPENTRALRFLLDRQFGGQDNPARQEVARQTAAHLSKISPEDGSARALLGVLLLEGNKASPDAVRRLLKEADPDPAAAGAIWYAHALMARQSGDTASARDNFERAAAFDRRFANAASDTGTAATKGKDNE